MSAPNHQPPQLNRGIVKQVLSGDTVVIRGQPKGGPPPEKTLALANITARKLARRLNPGSETSEEIKEQPWAWEAREFLRKRLIGKEIVFTVEFKVPNTDRECGVIYLGKDTTGENLTESLVAEGLVEVRKSGAKQSEDYQRLRDLEDSAKSAQKGIWSPDSAEHVRNITWVIENPRNFVDSLHQKPQKATIEHVRDGSTARAFLFIQDQYYYVTVMMSGIRCPMFKAEKAEGEPFADEAKFFTESRLLQRDVEIILESVSNNNFLGTIIHPNGSICEVLLSQGFARCVDWSIAFVSTGAEKLRAAERVAKERKLRIWKDYNPSGPQIDAKDREYQAKVMEVVNADALMVKLNSGQVKKIFLASIRPPRLPENPQPDGSQKSGDVKGRSFRPLYDIPYMFEAREFLRKKLIGKKVSVTIDYIQPPTITANTNFPERTCCTVMIGGVNVAEALVSKGYATVIRYRQEDDQRSSHYDELLVAEAKAIKATKGLHGKKDIPVHRIADVSGDHNKAKQFLPFLERADRCEGIVEYVASGSRLRLYIPRETCLITFLLSGISCPRAARVLPGGAVIDGEPYGEEALNFTKEQCMQREVEIKVEAMDKAGNFIGWLWVEGENLSVGLVREGLASVHFTAEKSPFFRALQNAEEQAKATKLRMWSSYVEEDNKQQELKDEEIERKVNYKPVLVTEVRPDLHFYAQFVEQGQGLEELMTQMRQELSSNPPLPGAYKPRKGALCAAKFVDGLWYRAKIEKDAGSEVSILYIDYGNRQVTAPSNLAELPSLYHARPAAAHEYILACVNPPTDVDYATEAYTAFVEEVSQEKPLLLNVEYKITGQEFVSLLNADTKDDIARLLITDGLLLVETRREKRLQKLVSEYIAAQDSAKKQRLNIWQYGDFTEDDAKEFGYQR